MTTITIYDGGSIAISRDGSVIARARVRQDQDRTRAHRMSLTGLEQLDELTLPHARYSLAHDRPGSGVAGRADFERDLLAALGEG